MKSLTCDRCDHVAEGETFEDWMTALQPHYRAFHPDVMKDSSKGQVEMKQWVAENKARFEAVYSERSVPSAFPRGRFLETT